MIEKEKNQHAHHQFGETPYRVLVDDDTVFLGSESISDDDGETLEKDLPIVLERDLPIVSEAQEAADQARKEGHLISRELNPFGENLEQLVIYAISDIHQPGSEVGNRENGLKRLMATQEKKTKLKKAVKRRIAKSIVAGMIGGNKEKYRKVDPKIFVDAFMRTLDAITEKLYIAVNNPDESNIAHAIVDLGDRGNFYSDMGDVALTTSNYMTALQHMNEITSGNFNMQMAVLSGNHDIDLSRDGFESELFQRQLFGQPIFLQYVGGYALLAINTNLYSNHWQKYFDLERGKYKELKEKRDLLSGQNEELDALIQSYEVFFEIMAQEQKRQDELIKEVLSSGKKVAIFAHRETKVLKHIDLQNSNVTHIFAGHKHIPEEKLLENINGNGDQIQLVRIGAVFSTETDIELPQPSRIHIDGDNLEVENMEISSDKTFLL